MNARRAKLPAPDMSKTDPIEVLGRRIDFSIGADPISAHTRPNTGKGHARAGKGTRPDPAGMRRASLYVSEEAIKALEAAAERIISILGPDTPRHVALSALLLAGAAEVDAVASNLAQQRAADLRQRLAVLGQVVPEGPPAGRG